MICGLEWLSLLGPEGLVVSKIPLQVVARVKKASKRAKRLSGTRPGDAVSANGSENKLAVCGGVPIRKTM